MSEDLQRMFVEDAPQQVNELNNAETLSSHVLELDRKSTRLNSSHLVISYAVFCLKKKKKQPLTAY